MAALLEHTKILLYLKKITAKFVFTKTFSYFLFEKTFEKIFFHKINFH